MTDADDSSFEVNKQPSNKYIVKLDQGTKKRIMENYVTHDPGLSLIADSAVFDIEGMKYKKKETAKNITELIANKNLLHQVNDLEFKMLLKKIRKQPPKKTVAKLISNSRTDKILNAANYKGYTLSKKNLHMIDQNFIAIEDYKANQKKLDNALKITESEMAILSLRLDKKNSELELIAKSKQKNIVDELRSHNMLKRIESMTAQGRQEDEMLESMEKLVKQSTAKIKAGYNLAGKNIKVLRGKYYKCQKYLHNVMTLGKFVKPTKKYNGEPKKTSFHLKNTKSADWVSIADINKEII